MTGVLETLLELTTGLNGGLPTMAGLFSRLSLLFLMLPAIGGSSVPARSRLGLAVLLALLLLPLAAPVQAAQTATLVTLIAGEAFVGFALGLTVRVLLLSLNVTGAIIAQAMSLSQIFGVTQEGDSSSLLSTMLTMAASVLFLSAGLGVEAIAFLARSLETIPIGSAATLSSAVWAEQALALSAEALAFGVRLAIPFMVLNFSYYLVLGFLNRAMPQLMVTFVGIPAITLGGLILLTVSVGAILSVWLNEVAGLVGS